MYRLSVSVACGRMHAVARGLSIAAGARRTHRSFGPVSIFAARARCSGTRRRELKLEGLLQQARSLEPGDVAENLDVIHQQERAIERGPNEGRRARRVGVHDTRSGRIEPAMDRVAVEIEALAPELAHLLEMLDFRLARKPQAQPAERDRELGEE